MPETSLAQKLGHDYMDQFYRDALFSMDGNLYIYRGHASRDNILVHKNIKQKDNRGNEYRWSEDTVPSKNLTSMGDFSWPHLGYRNYKLNSLKGLNALYYISSSRSAMRGLRDGFLTFDPQAATTMFGMHSDLRNNISSAVYLREIFFPQFYSAQEAVNMLSRGEATGVALSHELAVGINPDTGDNNFSVYYRGRPIGSISQNMDVYVPRRLMKKMEVSRALGGFVRHEQA